MPRFMISACTKNLLQRSRGLGCLATLGEALFVREPASLGTRRNLPICNHRLDDCASTAPGQSFDYRSAILHFNGQVGLLEILTGGSGTGTDISDLVNVLHDRELLSRLRQFDELRG